MSGAGRPRSVIYLNPLLPTDLSSLPPGNGRATLKLPVYLALQPIRRTARDIAVASGGLLPRLFTLTVSRKRRRLFSVTLLCPFRQLSVKKYGALCCPDFPHAAQCRRATDRPARFLGGKGTNFSAYSEPLSEKSENSREKLVFTEEIL